MVLAELAVTVGASIRGEGLAVEEPKQWCPICNQPDDADALCRCDYPTQEQLIELLRKIYRDAETTEIIKQMIEDAFR